MFIFIIFGFYFTVNLKLLFVYWIIMDRLKKVGFLKNWRYIVNGENIFLFFISVGETRLCYGICGFYFEVFFGVIYFILCYVGE